MILPDLGPITGILERFILLGILFIINVAVYYVGKYDYYLELREYEKALERLDNIEDVSKNI